MKNTEHNCDREKFIIRTVNHILMVHSLLALCWTEYSGYMDMNLYYRHDMDKFDDDMIEPYIMKSNMCKSADGGKKTRITDSKQSYIDSAVVKHIANSGHHPEKWDRNFRKPSDVIYAYKMPYKYIIEMVCDWHAVAVEMGEKSAKSWADENIGKRWIFNNDQKDFIYSVIRFLSDFDVKQITEVPNSTIEKEMLRLGCVKYKITDEYKIYEHYHNGKSVYFELPLKLIGMERAVVVCSLLASLKFISKYKYMLPFVKRFLK